MHLRQAVAATAVMLLAGCLLGCSPTTAPEAATPTVTASTGTTPTGGTPTGGTPTGGTPTPKVGPTRVTQPVPITVDAEVSEAARDNSQDAVDELASVLAAPDGSEPDSDVVAGAAAEAIRNQASEYAQNGWRVEGQSRVTRVEIYEHDDSHMVVGACVDNSALRVMDRNGNTVSDGSDQPPTLNIYTLERRAAGWVVVDHSFPDDPDC